MKNREIKKDKKEQNTRREFLKKGLYTTPKLIILGTLTKPENSKAGFGPPPSDPNW